MQKLKDQVYDLLEKYPETRNCDGRLVAMYWGVHDPEHVFRADVIGSESTYIMHLDSLPFMTPASAIERMRRKIQQEGRFWPTDEAVAKRRRMNMEKWRDMMIALTPDSL